jgi:hypothetical protein
MHRPNLWFLPRAFFHARGPWVLAKHPVFPAPSRSREVMEDA